MTQVWRKPVKFEILLEKFGGKHLFTIFKNNTVAKTVTLIKKQRGNT